MSDRDVLTEKYVVARITGHQNVPSIPLQPGEFFVLRSKDLFASGTLRAYASAIDTFIESADMAGVVVEDDVLDRMHELHDYVSGLADRWERSAKQVPD
jgi:hypothetical protein